MWGYTQDFPLVTLTKRNYVDYGQDHEDLGFMMNQK